MKTVDDIGQSK